MVDRSVIKITQVRKECKGRKQSMWDWLRRTVTNFWYSCRLFGKLLKRIKKIFFTLAITFLSFQSKKNVGTKQCHSSNNSLNHQKTEQVEHVEENAVVKKTSISELQMINAKVHAIEQSTAIINCNAKKLVVVTQPEEMVNKHLNDNLSDFIFDDNYFEDSWGLHSDLFATYTHQMNTFTSTTSLRITTACNISVKIPKQPTRILKAVHLEDIEGKTEEKYFLSDEFSTLNRTDYNLNGFSFSNSFFENSYIGISIIDE